MLSPIPATEQACRSRLRPHPRAPAALLILHRARPAHGVLRSSNLAVQAPRNRGGVARVPVIDPGPEPPQLPARHCALRRRLAPRVHGARRGGAAAAQAAPRPSGSSARRPAHAASALSRPARSRALQGRLPQKPSADDRDLRPDLQGPRVRNGLVGERKEEHAGHAARPDQRRRSQRHAPRLACGPAMQLGRADPIPLPGAARAARPALS